MLSFLPPVFTYFLPSRYSTHKLSIYTLKVQNSQIFEVSAIQNEVIKSRRFFCLHEGLHTMLLSSVSKCLLVTSHHSDVTLFPVWQETETWRRLPDSWLASTTETLSHGAYEVEDREAWLLLI